MVRANGNRRSISTSLCSPRIRKLSAPVRSATLSSAGSTVSMEMSANRMPTPPMKPNSENPRKSAIWSTNSAEAVVSALTAIDCPVLANVSSAADATLCPLPRSSA